MIKLYGILSIVLFFLPITPSHAVHTIGLPKPVNQLATSNEMTVQQVLSIDPAQITKSKGIKQAWVKRWVVRQAQHRLKKQIAKGKLTPETALNKHYSKGSNSNKRGMFSLIFGAAGLMFLFLGPLVFLALPLGLAAFILGIIGIRKDQNTTMAILGVVLGALTLVIILLVLLVIIAFLGY